MRNLKKMYNQMQNIENIYSNSYVISQNEKEWKKWEILNETRKFFIKECEKQGINLLEIITGKEIQK